MKRLELKPGVKVQMEYELLSSIYKKAEKMMSEVRTIPEGWTRLKETLKRSEKEVQKSAHFTKRCVKTVFIDQNELSEIEIWYGAYLYRKKYYTYRRLLNKFKREHENLIDEFNAHEYDLTAGSLKQKLFLVESLLGLAVEQVTSYRKSVDFDFQLLESELSMYLTSEDIASLTSPGVTKSTSTLLHFYIKKVLRSILRIIRKILRSRKRDVRTELREVVRCHFKNMDDESDADQSLIQNINRLIHYKLIFRCKIKKPYNNLITY